jgi:hypothetical protein
MTDRLDRLIEEALTEEDRMIREATAERGWFALGLDQFRGKLGWVTWVVMIVQTVMFGLAVWCGYEFYTATEVLVALKWGLSAATLALMAIVLKLSLMPQIQADRVLRELRRVELMLATRDARK